MEKFNTISATLTKTLESVNEIQSSFLRKAGGISEQARRAILDDVKAKVEETRGALKTTMEQQVKVINESLDQLLARLEELKTIPVSDNGEIHSGVKA